MTAELSDTAMVNRGPGLCRDILQPASGDPVGHWAGPLSRKSGKTKRFQRVEAGMPANFAGGRADFSVSEYFATLTGGIINNYAKPLILLKT
jgi:hypothetical protein